MMKAKKRPKMQEMMEWMKVRIMIGIYLLSFLVVFTSEFTYNESIKYYL